jgi:hypothetical protein
LRVKTNIEASKNENIMATDKIIEKIGDHYNNPEMADRILVVKVRPQGWEMQEAAKLASSYVNKNAVKREKGKAEKTLKHEKTDEPNHCLRKNDNKSKSKGTGEAHKQPGTVGSIETASSVFNNDIDAELSSGQEGYSSKCGIKRKKNNSDDSIVLPEEISFTFENSSLEEDSKSPIVACEATDLNPTEIEKATTETEEAESDLEDVVELTDNEIIQADKKICVEIKESHPIDCKNQELDTGELDTCVVCEHEIYVHSFWLALNSPYFRGLFFSSGMKETKDEKVS